MKRLSAARFNHDMIVPADWAEARAQRREQHRQVTVCRFGQLMESIGSGATAPEVRPVLEWHDARSGARTQKPLLALWHYRSSFNQTGRTLTQRDS